MYFVRIEPATQQASGRRPTPRTARPVVLAIFLLVQGKKCQKFCPQVVRSGVYDKLHVEIVFLINILIHGLYTFPNYHYTWETSH